ncbi:hypothetical protein Tco_0291052 [Tanacetum coccineum]
MRVYGIAKVANDPCDVRLNRRVMVLFVGAREFGLGVDVKDNYEPYTKPDIDPVVQEVMDACIAFADDIAARGTDVKV